MKTIEIIDPIITSLANLFLKNKQDKKLNEVLDSKHFEPFLDKIDNKFIQQTIAPELECRLFYMLTGIYTNHNSIEKFQILYNQLGAKYTWKDISLISNFLKIQDNLLVISISKKEKFMSKFFLALSLILILTGYFIFISIDFKHFDITNSITKIAASFFFPIFGYFIFNSSHPLIVSCNMKNELESRIISES